MNAGTLKIALAVSVALNLFAVAAGVTVFVTRAEVETALGADSNPGAVGGPEPEACDTFHPARAPTGLRVMVEQGVLTSIWLATRRQG